MKKLIYLLTKTTTVLVLCSLTTQTYGATIAGWVDYATVYRLDVGVSGEVKAVHVSEGDQVKAGEVLLELDAGHLSALVDAAAAKKAVRQAKMEEAERAYERDEVLYDEGSLSAVDLALREIELLETTADFQHSKAELAQHHNSLRLSKITAPVAGVVLLRHTNPGERIVIENRSEPAFLFAGEDRIVKAELGSSATAPDPGSIVSIEFNGNSAQGRITSIDTTSSPGVSKIIIHSDQPLPAAGRTVQIQFE